MSRPPNRVFIGNLPFDASEQMLADIFGEVGPIRSMRLVTDKDTGKPKGFAFCEYHDQFAAESAVRNLNSHDLNGRQIRVDFADDATGPRDVKRERDTDGGRRGGPERDARQPLPLGGPPGTKAVGVSAAGTAAASMASMLGGPAGPGPVQESTNSVLGGMSPMQLYAIMGQMRALIQQNPGQARHTLISNPQLTKALFQAQIMLGMVKPPPGVVVPPPTAAGALPPPPQTVVPPTLSQPPVQPVVSLPLGSVPPAAVVPAPAPLVAPHILPAAPAYNPPPPQPYGAAIPPQQAAPTYSMGPNGVLQLVQPPVMSVDPTQQGLPYGVMPAPAQPTMPAVPQPQTQPAPAAPAISGDQAAVLQQVMTMTQEQIDALPDVTRQQVLQVKQLLMAQGQG